MQTWATGAAALSLALSAGLAQAQTQPPADTTSLAGWQSLGDVLAQAGALTLSSADLDGADDQADNRSGRAAANIALIEAAAGLPVYALDRSDDQYGTEGALVAQSFAVATGQVLSLRWGFSSRETTAALPNEDHAFAVIDGQRFTLASRSQPGALTQVFSHRFAQAGTVRLALGVIDTVDYLGVSTLQLSELQLSAVPEPQAAGLLLAGLIGLGGALRCRRPNRLLR